MTMIVPVSGIEHEFSAANVPCGFFPALPELSSAKLPLT
jgi:hypothetical protein